MPPRNRQTLPDAPADAVPSETPAPAVDPAITAKLEALRIANAAAVQTLGTHFGERWPKIVQRAERMGIKPDQIASLAGKMISTRKDRYPTNERAALLGAALGFLCALDLRPSDEEAKAFEAAIAAPAV